MEKLKKMATITSEIKPNNNEASSCSITIDDEEEEMNYAYAYRLVNSCTLPMVIKVTINMGVLQLIHDHASPSGLSAEEIATRVNIPNPNAPAMLDRMLRLLATYLVVGCTTVTTTDGGLERRYNPSRVTKFFVVNDDRASLASLNNLLMDKTILESWSALDEAITKGGIPYNIVHGMSMFEYASIDSRLNEVFNNAMHQTTPFVVKKILEKYKGLENIQQLVDVGVEHVSGDMFQAIPKGDAIFMKWILHDWNDEHCLKLLKNCYNALPKNGKVIVVEEMIANEAESTNSSKATSQMDVLMMIVAGGKERNRQQFEALAIVAGFSNVNFDCCVYNFWVMEFYK
ncbi:Caffeic acid 3-O-methyltransferase [Bienertia sinuspersici]